MQRATRIFNLWTTRLDKAATDDRALTRGEVNQLTQMLSGYGKRTALTAEEMELLRGRFADLSRAGLSVSEDMQRRGEQLLRGLSHKQMPKYVRDVLADPEPLVFTLVGIDYSRDHVFYSREQREYVPAALPLYRVENSTGASFRYSCAPRQWMMMGFEGQQVETWQDI